jgi:hypothetical protein
MNAKVFTPVTGASSPELQVMSQVGPPEEDIFEEAVLSEILFRDCVRMYR